MRPRALAAAWLLPALLAHAQPAPTPLPTPTPAPPPVVENRCFSGECFPRVANIASVDVPLSGAGTLTYLGFRVYTAALYAPAESGGIDAILGREPVQLVLRYHREISRKDIDRSVDQALARNPDVDIASLAQQIARMKGFHRDVRAGDSYVLVHEPGTGLIVRFNGEDLGTIAGDDFAVAYLGIWLSRRPLSESLRKKLTQGLAPAPKEAPKSGTAGSESTK